MEEAADALLIGFSPRQISGRAVPELAERLAEEFLVPLFEEAAGRLGRIKVVERLLAQIVDVNVDAEEVKKVAAGRQRELRRPNWLLLGRLLLIVNLANKGNAVRGFPLLRFW